MPAGRARRLIAAVLRAAQLAQAFEEVGGRQVDADQHQVRLQFGEHAWQVGMEVVAADHLTAFCSQRLLELQPSRFTLDGAARSASPSASMTWVSPHHLACRPLHRKSNAMYRDALVSSRPAGWGINFPRPNRARRASFAVHRLLAAPARLSGRRERWKTDQRREDRREVPGFDTPHAQGGTGTAQVRVHRIGQRSTRRAASGATAGSAVHRRDRRSDGRSGQMADCERGPCGLHGACILKGVLDRAERAFFDGLKIKSRRRAARADAGPARIHAESSVDRCFPQRLSCAVP